MNIAEKFSPARLLHPIDDLDKRASAKNYSDAERTLRCQLASAYRLVDLYGWSEGIYNHITDPYDMDYSIASSPKMMPWPNVPHPSVLATDLPVQHFFQSRLPGDDDRFLINPFGLLFHEITASSLITLDPDGNIIDHGSTRFSPNPRGFTLHSAVHQARRDVQCVLHLHMPEVIVISCTKDGFVPLCQEGLALGQVPTLEFSGILTDLNERESIVSNLGKNNALLLRNHGFFTCGATIPDALLKAYFFLYNIRAQINLAAVDHVVTPSPEAARRTYEVLSRGEKTENQTSVVLNGSSSSDIVWGPGGLDWEANMRLLDSMGLKTGHKYRLDMWRDGE